MDAAEMAVSHRDYARALSLLIVVAIVVIAIAAAVGYYFLR